MRPWLVFFVVALLVVTLIVRIAPSLRGAVYAAVVERTLRTARAHTSSWQMLQSENIELRHKDDPAVAAVILEIAEEMYQRVSEDLQYDAPSKVLVLSYPSKDELRREFGWPSSEDAMGVYYGGSVRVVSPASWVGTDNIELLAERFRSEGPLAHEFTHLLLDYATKGNYPRWFSEGLAQYEEYLVTGYLWVDVPPRGKFQFYDYRQMQTAFDRLPDQAIAYRQAFLMLEYMVARNRWQSVVELIEALGRGARFEDAVRRVYAKSIHSIDAAWREAFLNTALAP